jgi:hypothetical protein
VSAAAKEAVFAKFPQKIRKLIRQFGKPPALPVRLEKAMPFLR